MNKSYMTNFGLEFLTDKFYLTSAHSLNLDLTDEAKSIVKDSHIYCIVDCPRIMIDPNSLSYEIFNNYLIFSLILVYRINGVVTNKKIIMGVPTLIPNTVVKLEVAEYPHIAIKLLDVDNHLIATTTVYEIAYQFQIEDLVSMKVLYIGKSIGNDENRNALDRLKNHSTFQNILADRNAQHPDRAVFVSMFKFKRVKKYTIMDGWDISKIGGDEDFDRILKANKAEIPLEQQVSIIEMALIRYFKPEYNKKLKKDLPARKSKILEICNKYDFSGVAVNFCIDNLKYPNLNFYFYTDKRKIDYAHSIRLELIDPEIRKGFFSLGGESWAPQEVIRHNKK